MTENEYTKDVVGFEGLYTVNALICNDLLSSVNLTEITTNLFNCF